MAAEHRRRLVRRIAFSVLSILTVAAVAASVLAFVALRQSRDHEAEAENRFARGLATQAESLASTHPKLALALAAESAARLDPIPAEAQEAIVTARLALSSSDIVPNSEPIPVGDVLTTLVTPDGSTIVTGARDGTVQLWDAQTGEPTSTLTGPTDGIEEAAVDPSGRWLVAVGADGLWRWDLGSSETEGELVDRPPGALWSVAFTADGERLATTAEDGVVQIYDTSSWRRQGEPFTADVDFLSVTFTPDGKRLLAGTGEGRVFIWDVAQHTMAATPIAAHGTNDVWELVVDPAGQRVATASSDGTAHVWSLDNGALVATPFVNADGVRSLDEVSGLVWSADGRSLYAGGNDGRVHEWDVQTATQVDQSAIGHDDRVTDAFASADQAVLVTLGRDQDVRVWDMANRGPVETTMANVGTPSFGLAINADGSRIAVGDEQGVVRVFSDSGEPIELDGHSGRVFGVAFLPDGRLLTGGDDGALRLWDVDSAESTVVREDATPGAITSLAVNPRGDRVASSSADGVIRVWSPNDLDEPLAQTVAQGGRANKVVFTAAGDLVAAYNDGKVRFWHADGSEQHDALQVDADGDAVFSVAVSPDEQLLAAATATDGITLWRLGSDQPASELNGQPIGPVDAVFSPDGTVLVSASREGIVTLWNSLTGQSLGPRFDYHSDAVWRTAVSPTGAVFSASEDGTVARLDVLDVSQACEMGTGALDPRARERYLGDREPIGCTA